MFPMVRTKKSPGRFRGITVLEVEFVARFGEFLVRYSEVAFRNREGRMVEAVLYEFDTHAVLPRLVPEGLSEGMGSVTAGKADAPA